MNTRKTMDTQKNNSKDMSNKNLNCSNCKRDLPEGRRGYCTKCNTEYYAKKRATPEGRKQYKAQQKKCWDERMKLGKGLYVYIITGLGGILYVGATRNYRIRFDSHYGMSKGNATVEIFKNNLWINFKVAKLTEILESWDETLIIESVISEAVLPLHKNQKCNKKIEDERLKKIINDTLEENWVVYRTNPNFTIENAKKHLSKPLLPEIA